MLASSVDLARLDALLRMPDPPDLPRRAHRITQVGEWSRRSTVLLPLLVRWVQQRYVLIEDTPSDDIRNDYIPKI